MDAKGPVGRPQREIAHDGRVQTLREWAREAGLHHETLRYRLRAGWDMETALSTPATRRVMLPSDVRALLERLARLVRGEPVWEDEVAEIDRILEDYD